MISKLENQELPAGHKDKWGGYNDFPPGWAEISMKELVQATPFSTYQPVYIEHRQMIRNKDESPLNINKMVEASLYFYHDGTGIGIVCDYWGEKVTYYRFGCQHTYQEISTEECRKRGIYHGGRCYHVSVCTKCGQINAVDSSD